MGKVYDALRRAEAQRTLRREPVTSIRAMAPAVAEPPADTAPEAVQVEAPPPPQRVRPSLSRRLLRIEGRERPETAGAINKRRVSLLQPDSHVADQFRTLRARIDSAADGQLIRSVAVTSALLGDGKTLAAINLAVVNSMQVGCKVLLVDCDLRRPAVQEALSLRVDAGLGELLEGQASMEEAVQRVEGCELDVVAVRMLPPNPAELLASSRMRQLIEEAVGKYDRVILDLPPTLGLPDAKIVSELCDGVVFVVRAEATPQEDIESAIELLDRRRIIGLVLNDSEPEIARHDYSG